MNGKFQGSDEACGVVNAGMADGEETPGALLLSRLRLPALTTLTFTTTSTAEDTASEGLVLGGLGARCELPKLRDYTLRSETLSPRPPGQGGAGDDGVFIPAACATLARLPRLETARFLFRNRCEHRNPPAQLCAASRGGGCAPFGLKGFGALLVLTRGLRGR